MAFLDVETVQDGMTLAVGFDRLNTNFDTLENSSGAQEIGLDNTGLSYITSSNLQAAIAELDTYNGTHEADEDKHLTIEQNKWLDNIISPIQDQINNIQNGYETVPPIETGSVQSLDYTTSTLRTLIDAPIGTIRLHTTSRCYIAFGDDSVDATSSDIMFLGGPEIIGVPDGATYIAILAETQDGTANIASITGNTRYNVGTTSVLNYTTSSGEDIDLPTNSGMVRLYNSTFCYVRLGTTTVTASPTTGFILSPGLSKLVIPTGYDRIDIYPETENGTAYITGLV
jgi:hypothetical protein